MEVFYLVAWAAVMIVMLVIEAVTFNLLTIWFAVGALAAIIAAALGASFPLQMSVFFVVSGVLLMSLMPYMRRRTAAKHTATNADRIIGCEAVVTEEIDGISGTGQINVIGSIWSAKSEDGAKIAKGEHVIVNEITGVKAVVSRL